MRQAVILAGGKGTRLRSVLGDVPKPLADVGGLPLLSHQLRLLRQHDFTDIVVLVDYRADQIQAWADAQDQRDIRITLVADGVPRGTAGAVLAAADLLAPEFLVMYADTMVEVDLSRFIAWHATEPETAASLFVHPNDHPQDSDLVETDASGRILRFHSYPHPAGAWLPNLVNAALYVVRREALLLWRDEAQPLDFAKDLFPRMLDGGALLRAYNSPEYVKDAGTPERLDRVRRAYAAGVPGRSSLSVPQRAVLLDRDGTLNDEAGHIGRAEDLRVFDYVGPALRRLNEEGWRAVVLTNQPVLARGETTEDELRRIHARLDTEVARHHAFFDRLYYCPHHPDRGFPGEVAALKIACDCRKPEPGLVARAQADLNLDLAESWFVGDSTADLGAAERAGVSSILVETGSGGLDDRYPYEAGFAVDTMASAVDFIIDAYPRLAVTAAPLVRMVREGQDWFVGGLARSGKSTVAATLQREVRRRGMKCEIIHLDRWLKSADARGQDVFERYDMAALEAVVSHVASRTATPVSIELPHYRRRDRRSVPGALSKVLGPAAVVIWDGVVAVELARRLGQQRSVQVDTHEGPRRDRFFHYYARRGAAPLDVDRLYREREADEHRLILEAGVHAAHHVTLDQVFAVPVPLQETAS